MTTDAQLAFGLRHPDEHKRILNAFDRADELSLQWIKSIADATYHLDKDNSVRNEVIDIIRDLNGFRARINNLVLDDRTWELPKPRLNG